MLLIQTIYTNKDTNKFNIPLHTGTQILTLHYTQYPHPPTFFQDNSCPSTPVNTQTPTKTPHLGYPHPFSLGHSSKLLVNWSQTAQRHCSHTAL